MSSSAHVRGGRKWHIAGRNVCRRFNSRRGNAWFRPLSINGTKERNALTAINLSARSTGTIILPPLSTRIGRRCNGTNFRLRTSSRLSPHTGRCAGTATLRRPSGARIRARSPTDRPSDQTIPLPGESRSFFGHRKRRGSLNVPRWALWKDSSLLPPTKLSRTFFLRHHCGKQPFPQHHQVIGPRLSEHQPHAQFFLNINDGGLTLIKIRCGENLHGQRTSFGIRAFSAHIAPVEAKPSHARGSLVLRRAFAHFNGSVERITGCAPPVLLHIPPRLSDRDYSTPILTMLCKHLHELSPC